MKIAGKTKTLKQVAKLTLKAYNDKATNLCTFFAMLEMAIKDHKGK